MICDAPTKTVDDEALSTGSAVSFFWGAVSGSSVKDGIECYRGRAVKGTGTRIVVGTIDAAGRPGPQGLAAPWRWDVPWGQIATVQGTVVFGSSEHQTDFDDHTSVQFVEVLRRYLDAVGPDQVQLRENLSGHVARSREPKKRLQEILEALRAAPTQDRMEAAVDLLRKLGTHALARAKELSVQAQEVHDAEAYVVAMAAGQIDPSLIDKTLAQAGPAAMREAAAELAEELPSREARRLLKRLARKDRCAYVRKRAAALLAEIE